MKVGSLFSGIGGLDLGLERAGIEIIWQVENDSFCQKVLKKHWPEVLLLGDVKKIDFTSLPAVDLICGGFPCQPVSCAGKRAGDKDERWLWPEFYRAVCEARPRWVLVENVPGLMSMDSGRLFGGILRDLAASGYDVEWDLLPAAAFGAPHLRYRVFLVAYLPNNRLNNLIKRSIFAPKDRTNSTKGYAAFDVAHAYSDRTGERYDGGTIGENKGKIREGRNSQDSENEGTYPDNCNSNVAHSESRRLEVGETTQTVQHNVECRGVFLGRLDCGDTRWWATEPDVGRVAHGVPSRVDRLKCLGNAVVPQISEWIGIMIMEVENF